MQVRIRDDNLPSSEQYAMWYSRSMLYAKYEGRRSQRRVGSGYFANCDRMLDYRPRENWFEDASYGSEMVAQTHRSIALVEQLGNNLKK